MTRKLTILFAPMEGVGHVNACIGLAEALHSRGHKIVFVVVQEFKGKLSSYGFHEELLEVEEQKKDVKPGENAADRLMKEGYMSPMSSFEKLKISTNSDLLNEWVKKAKDSEPQLKQIVAKHKPDVIIIDAFIGSPTLIYSEKPWVRVFSGNPLSTIKDERTPPGGSGFPTNGDRESKEWKEFRELKENSHLKYNIEYNEWLKENGYPTINNKKLIPDSPYLNIYGYPEKLDYLDIRPLPDKWFRVDALERKGEQEFIFPEELRDRDEKTQKLIYFSLGSMGSANIELMKRLVQILSKSPHKVIVSKGLSGDKYELADNMWGANSVPQTKVLPLVDLVITHGGNNTVSETFSAGKPMIVMPLFADQFDNAQRVQEKGFGLRMDAHNCTEDELLGGIEKLLNDNDLKNRLNIASKRMTNSQSLVNACKQIENLVV